MPGPVRQSNLVKQANIASSAVDGATISGVVAGNALVAIVYAHRASGSSGDIVSGYGTTIGGSAANTWTLAARSKRLDDGGVWCLEMTIWVALNVAAGTTVGKPTFNFTDALYVWSHMDEWSGIATSSAVDKTDADYAINTATTITTGATATLAQASEVVITAIGTRLAYSWNGSSTGAGTAPSTYTILQGTTDNADGVTGQSAYKEVTATTGVSATWTYANAQTAVAAIVTLKQATTTLRLEIDDIDSTDISGTTGWTFWAWSGDPLDAKAVKRWTSYAASISGTKLVFDSAPAGAAANDTYNVMGYQPSGTLTTGFMVGTVRAV
jgi:hypothetical protein